ncbi:MAG: 2-amino-4-hydroxy-6-hydroxymethyldihydropteridine diphosphokinase, partial [Pseudomonadota bacterium]
MKLIALGSNLPHATYGDPINVVTEALKRLPQHGVVVREQSPWYASKPVPISDQPDYINGVALVEYGGDPGGLLAALHAVEASLGRARS